MNINEQLAEINELKERLKVLENEVLNSVQPKQEYRRWRAETNKECYYYCVNIYNEVIQTADTSSNVDNSRYKVGNYFKTREEAEEYTENLITKQKLKDLALRLNKGVEIDWENTNKDKYFIGFSHEIKSLMQVSNCAWQYLNTIYCLDENFLEIAKEEIGEKALIKLIESGV